MEKCGWRVLYWMGKMKFNIIKSFLDTDFYKFTMGQFVWKHYPDIPIVYAFKCRTKDVQLGKIMDFHRLHRVMEEIRELKPTEEEIRYLSNLNAQDGKIFSKDYLDFLSNIKLPPFRLDVVGDNLIIEVGGKWSEAIYWETFILSAVNELYYREIIRDHDIGDIMEEGIANINYKKAVLKTHPEVKFIEFGTRRRFSRVWQSRVFDEFLKLGPAQCLGTSNVFLAKEYNSIPRGTMAHELFMVAAGIYRSIDETAVRASQFKTMYLWEEMYGEHLSIALTDTFGSEFFFKTCPDHMAKSLRGLRQDSGNPLEFGERAIKFYRENEIDPKSKQIVFSDGLTVNAMIHIASQFKDRIGVNFGWGTNLTNDLGLKPLSIVVKPKIAAGNNLVKLSDNLAKATGHPEEVALYKKIFGYVDMGYQECIY